MTQDQTSDTPRERKLTVGPTTSRTWPWAVIMPSGCQDGSTYDFDVMARVKTEELAHQFAASDTLARERGVMKAALERIAANRYGHQGLVEDGAPDAEIASYYAQVATDLQRIARTALSTLSTEKPNG